jgi:hypothetical protein
VVCANNGIIYYSNDFCNTWNAQIDTSTKDWSAVSISGNGQIAYGVVKGGYVYKCMGTNI